LGKLSGRSDERTTLDHLPKLIDTGHHQRIALRRL
jgi:hypothetical protein